MIIYLALITLPLLRNDFVSFVGGVLVFVYMCMYEHNRKEYLMGLIWTYASLQNLSIKYTSTIPYLSNVSDFIVILCGVVFVSQKHKCGERLKTVLVLLILLPIQHAKSSNEFTYVTMMCVLLRYMCSFNENNVWVIVIPLFVNPIPGVFFTLMIVMTCVNINAVKKYVKSYIKHSDQIHVTEHPVCDVDIENMPVCNIKKTHDIVDIVENGHSTDMLSSELLIKNGDLNYVTSDCLGHADIVGIDMID